MRDTIDKHGAIKSPSGSWIGESKRVLVLNAGSSSQMETSTTSSKRSKIGWTNTRRITNSNGYTYFGAVLSLSTDNEVLFFRMYWDDRIPK